MHVLTKETILIVSFYQPVFAFEGIFKFSCLWHFMTWHILARMHVYSYTLENPSSFHVILCQYLSANINCIFPIIVVLVTVYFLENINWLIVPYTFYNWWNLWVVKRPNKLLFLVYQNKQTNGWRFLFWTLLCFLILLP